MPVRLSLGLSSILTNKGEARKQQTTELERFTRETTLLIKGRTLLLPSHSLPPLSSPVD
uniref:Uncharacterized protein n=1 Tax=Picea glauca TaxID=3330 RepID=A0A101LUC1_PICGL|nr:hypothetical protein ABT39_MTgene3486 [Picea glauca]